MLFIFPRHPAQVIFLMVPNNFRNSVLFMYLGRINIARNGEREMHERFSLKRTTIFRFMVQNQL